MSEAITETAPIVSRQTTESTPIPRPGALGRARHPRDLVALIGQDGTILDISAAVTILLGHDPATVIGTSGYALLHVDDREIAISALSTILGGDDGLAVDVRLHHADDSWRWFEIAAADQRDTPDVQGIILVAHEISDRKLVELALRASEQQFRLLFAAHPYPMWVYDRETLAFLEVNNTAMVKYGYTRDEFLDMTIEDIQPPEDIARSFDTSSSPEPNANGSPWWHHRLKDGRIIDVDLTSREIDFDVRPAKLVVVMDVTERQALQRQLTHLAYHDALTSLPNRAFFSERLAQALRLAPGTAIMFIDLDDFKLINDSLGHGVGDELLISVAERLRSVVRPQDFLARLGGDEFTVLMESSEQDDEARDLAEQLNRVLRHPFMIDGHELFLTASIGIARAVDLAAQSNDLLRIADIAMYTAKNLGKDRVITFDASMDDHDWHRLELTNSLRRAIEYDELCLYYQPIIDLASGEINEWEALVRWNHPERGLVMPGQFIPAAEASGLIVPLGEWVLRRACTQLREWDKQVTGGVRPVISVNLSPRQFQESHLVATVATILAETGILPNRLRLELTETVALEEIIASTSSLRELREMGVGLSLDDFGTGYSGLSYLRRCPVDRLKIDRSYIVGLGHDAADSAMIRGVVAFARELGVEVVAEGVETIAQHEAVQAAGCAQAQGYWYAHPMPSEAVTERLRAAAHPNMKAIPV